MSSLTRLLSVLDLFTEERGMMDVDTIAKALDLSVPTAYRYVRELTSAGILVKLGNEYGLGTRIIRLDLQMRKCDRLLQVGSSIADELCEMTNSNVLLTSIYGNEAINVHESTNGKIKQAFGRGETMPFGRGASSRAILAFIKRSKLRRMYDAHSGFDVEWKAFQQQLNEIKHRGYEISFGELDASLVGVAAPILDGEGQAFAAISVLVLKNRAELYRLQSLGAHVVSQAARISREMRAEK